MENQIKISERVVSVIYRDKFNTEHTLLGPVSESFAKFQLSKLASYWNVSPSDLRIIDSVPVVIS